MERAELNGSVIDAGVLSLIKDERDKALSAREWKFRLRGYGYGVKDVDGGQMLTRLSNGTELGVLPADIA